MPRVVERRRTRGSSSRSRAIVRRLQRSKTLKFARDTFLELGNIVEHCRRLDDQTVLPRESCFGKLVADDEAEPDIFAIRRCNPSARRMKTIESSWCRDDARDVNFRQTRTRGLSVACPRRTPLSEQHAVTTTIKVPRTSSSSDDASSVARRNSPPTTEQRMIVSVLRVRLRRHLLLIPVSFEKSSPDVLANSGETHRRPLRLVRLHHRRRSITVPLLFDELEYPMQTSLEDVLILVPCTLSRTRNARRRRRRGNRCNQRGTIVVVMCDDKKHACGADGPVKATSLGVA